MKTVFFLFFFSIALHAKPTICLNMIVKDEAHVIERCLDSVKPLIDTWVIVDTGSTDGTQDIIRKSLQDFPGELHESPWIDFSTNRNEALALAKGQADYLLFIDADDILQYETNTIFDELDKDYYVFHVQQGKLSFKKILLVKEGLPWVWRGVLHERIDPSFPATFEELSTVAYIASCEGNRSQDPEKNKKEIALLKRAVEQNPQDTHALYNLATTYAKGGYYTEALLSYEKLLKMDPPFEEVYASKYHIALIKEVLGANSEEVVAAFFDAFSFYPRNLEPLMALCKYFEKKDFALLGYIVVRQGLEIPYDDSFVFHEPWIYEWGLKYYRALFAYQLSLFEESLQFALEVLQTPTLPEKKVVEVESLVQVSLRSLSTTL